MRILFVHQNFPAQFGAFGLWLAQQGWDVTFATARQDARPPAGCRMIRFAASREPNPATHRYLQGTEKAVLNGQGFARAAIAAAQQGYRPDLIVAHSGWGSGSFAKAVWPDAPLVGYIEWYYRWPLVDRLEPAPEDGNPADERARLLMRNTPFLIDAAQSELLLCPTEFQASQFPADLRRRMTVIHDGIDTTRNRPVTERRMVLPGLDLSGADEIVSYATRSMEPHRGFPEFMRALAVLQRRRPGLHAVIAGEDRVAYGAQLPEGESWKGRMLSELELDPSRIHFTGLLPRQAFWTLLQNTQAHVYFTVPFVLSWSLLEAMSAGAPIVASDVAPVREVLTHGISARLVQHRDIDAAGGAIESALDQRSTSSLLAAEARRVAVDRYDISKIYGRKAELLHKLVVLR